MAMSYVGNLILQVLLTMILECHNIDHCVLGLFQRKKERKVNRETFVRRILPCQMKELKLVISGEYGHILPHIVDSPSNKFHYSV